MVLTLTIDTQCLRYLDPEHETPCFVAQLTALLALREGGLVDLARVGEMVEEDLADASRREEWLGKIEALPVDDIAGVAILGQWILGWHVLGSGEAQEVLDDPDLLPMSIDGRDRLHLHAHRAHGRDIFVTNDHDILRCRADLATADIVVMDPVEALRAVEEFLGASSE